MLIVPPLRWSDLCVGNGLEVKIEYSGKRLLGRLAGGVYVLGEVLDGEVLELLSQTQISLSQTQLRQLACPKSIEIVTNGAPVALFELKLGRNESYGLWGPFKNPPGPP